MASEHATPGELVRQHRVQHGLTQTTLARLVFSGQPRISHIERGELPSLDMAERLEQVLGLGGRLRERVRAEHDRRAAVRGTCGDPLAPAPGLVGRESEMQWLDTALAAGYRHLALDGPAGCGKTALATAWSAQHGDAVLVTGHVLEPERRARGFGEFAAELVRQLGGRCASADPAALVRAVRRAARPGQIVVLDDVDGDQVAPLLPALGHCIVVFTARHRQHALAISHHVRRLAV